ncbi:MAG: ABC transporter permease [Chlamydiae bacterium CG10_big_fil_rev_8_21_14_0_10_42_34]|nr:MAG: ABC transporter permease [Chlamydiae bacterium CG10_big_fil_rev_8_21_14_0_10_42_34]
MQGYVSRVYQARYFCMHLVLSDLRTKYRRSFFGILWSVIHPLALTLILGFVMGKLFHSPISSYAPYILSGLVLWEFIVSSATTGCNAFINAESYIQQFAHPVVIYSLRSTLTCFVNFCIALIGLLIWIIVWKPEILNISWMSVPFSLLLLFLIAWPLATITAFITLFFRDFSQLVILFLQAVWYVSPVFFLPTLFKNAGIEWILYYNPIYHALELLRAPLLRGEFPLMQNFVACSLTTCILSCISLFLLRTREKKVIFYL